MTRRISRIQVAIGLEGLALLRDYPSIDEQELRTRLEEIDRLRGHLADPANVLVVRDVDAGSGYEAWASTYDEDARTANPLISVEEPVVQSLLDACPPGLALDAACGTGRHAANLIRRGHRVTGLDSSPEMLAVAARNVQGARLVTGSLQALPGGSAACAHLGPRPRRMRACPASRDETHPVPGIEGVSQDPVSYTGPQPPARKETR